MAAIQGIIAVVLRSAGKVFNTAFGWASVMLFGRVPENRQVYLSIISFGAVIWILVLFGIAFPLFGAWLITLAKPPRWLNPNWVRTLMLVAAVVIPPIVGFFSTKAMDSPRASIWSGYRITLGLAVTLVLLTLLAPLLKLKALSRRWVTEHIPVIVEPDDYLSVVADIQKALKQAGRETRKWQAHWMLRLPTRLLAALSGDGFKSLMANRLVELHGKGVEVVLHPSDLVISGSEKDTARVREVIAEQLVFSSAYLTWSKEANELEDALRDVWRLMRSAQPEMVPTVAIRRMQDVEESLREAPLSYEEWDTLFRQKLMVERGMLQLAAGLAEHPLEPSETPDDQIGAERLLARGGLLPAIGTAATLGAVAWAGLGAIKKRTAS